MSNVFDIKAFKQDAGSRREILLTRLRTGSIEAHHFTMAMSDQTDQNIRTLANHYIKDHGKICSLVFTGGNGREEIYPGSDLDILLLVPEEMHSELSPELEQDWSSFITALWDCGYEPGAIVRTVKQCRDEALKDQTVWSSLLDRRLIWGNLALFKSLNTEMAQLNKAHWQEFLDQKLAERSERHKNKSDSRYNLQPDIKEGKGGLRDYHTMMWISQVVFGCEDVDELAAKGYLSPAESQRVESAYNFLLSARCHLQDGNRGNQLTAELQPKLAKRILQYEPEQRQEAIEDYMRLYFLHARDIGFLTNVVCAAAIEKKTGENEPALRDDGFVNIGSKLHFSSDSPKTSEMLRIFALANSEDKEVHPDALRIIKRNLRKFNERSLESKRNNKIFLDILTSDYGAATTLRRMQEVGILPKFVPPLDGIDMKMQFDPYHTYTVDEHTFQALDKLFELQNEKLTTVAKSATDITKNLNYSERKILSTALLLHDTGKDITETGDEDTHPIRGAEITISYAKRFGLSKTEAEIASWLVENHLLLAHTALRRELSDPWTVDVFAKKVGSEKSLDLLMVMSTADIMSNGPNSWDPNTAARIENLYLRTKAYMRSEAFDLSQDKIQKEQALHTQVRLKSDFTRNATIIEIVTAQSHDVFENLTAVLATNQANIIEMDFEANGDGKTATSRALIQTYTGCAFSERQIQELHNKIEKALEKDTKEIIKLPEKVGTKISPYRFNPEVEISNEYSEKSTVIEITAPDRPNLLTNLAKVFNETGLLVKHARISTYGKNFKAQDTFYVIDKITGKQINTDRFEEIRNALLESPALNAL